MQKFLLTLVVISGVAIFVNAGWVHNGIKSEPATKEAIAYFAEDPLKLSPEQQQQLASIVQNELDTIKTISDDSSLSAEEKVQKTREVIQRAKIEGASVLTIDQQKALGKLKEKHLSEIQSQIEKSPADVFVLQVITEDDDKVFPWLTQGQLQKRR